MFLKCFKNIQILFKIFEIFKKNMFVPNLKQKLSKSTTDLKKFQQMEINLEKLSRKLDKNQRKCKQL